MMKIVTYKKDGLAYRVTPAPQEHVCKVIPEIALLSADEFLQWVIAKDVPADAVDVQIIDVDLMTKREE